MIERTAAGQTPRAGWRRAVYRVGQFWRGLRAQVRPEELARAAALLPPPALALFRRMPPDAQRHSLNVLYTLEAAGYAQPALAAAALLHDVGKGAAQVGRLKLGLWLRGPLVLAEAWTPGLLRRLAVDNPGRGWRYGLYVHLHHAELGAAWAAQAGCDPLTCWLIAHHQDRAAQGAADPEGLLAALQWADGQN
jgi:hypothetical protein